LILEDAIQLVGEDLKAVEAEMGKNFFSEISMIPTVSRYLIASGGKRFRPILLLLCARLSGYHGPRAVPLASTIEFIHTATLLHDDVVDRAHMRRGMASANSVWGDGASVLVGDFLFTKSFHLIAEDGSLSILRLISKATNQLAEGEVMQLVKKGNPGTREEDYTFVVVHKTAVLISAACQIGGILGEASPDRIKAFADFGLNVGVAFQLIDDMLDYVADEQTLGKTIGMDLNEGKVTLPLIHALRTCAADQRERLVGMIQDPARSEEDLAFVLGMVRRCGGIDYTRKRAQFYVDQSKSALKAFSPSPEKEALQVIADYTIQRKK
jgi:octaprenyl-diphosphate synthase